MTGEVLVDTNVLVYAYDHSAPQKHQRALAVLRQLVQSRGVLSAQVLGEFFRAVTTKLGPRISPEDAYAQVQTLARAWRVVPVTSLVALESAGAEVDETLRTWARGRTPEPCRTRGCSRPAYAVARSCASSPGDRQRPTIAFSRGHSRSALSPSILRRAVADRPGRPVIC